MSDPAKQIHFSAADVGRMVAAIDELFAETSVLFNRNQSYRHPESIASKESELLKNPEQLETAFSIATISMESAADHLAAFSDLLKNPVKTLAPYTCVRSLMEMSALACWLLDPSIDVKTRLGRTFAHRYTEFNEQRKALALHNDNAQFEKVLKRIEKVENDAVALGFPKLRNKNDQIYGIAQPYPTIIELIDQTFGKEFEYRLLSGVAHGYMWALKETGFKLIDHDFGEGNKIKALTKELVPSIAIYFGMVAIVCFSRVLVSLWDIFGWRKDEIISLLEAAFDSLGFSEGIRFWRAETV